MHIFLWGIGLKEIVMEIKMNRSPPVSPTQYTGMKFDQIVCTDQSEFREYKTVARLPVLHPHSFRSSPPPFSPLLAHFLGCPVAPLDFHSFQLLLFAVLK
ncbi:hypothetical protein ABKN59_000126 [Abortiporus biennis]